MSPDEIENALIDLGVDVISVDKWVINFWLNGHPIQYWIKKQWFSGKGINDGRGLENMLKQVKKTKE